MSEPFSELGDAISDQRFVDVDLALRRGQHIVQDDADWYAYLLDAQAMLDPLYRRYGCELIHRSDGYFFLLPTGDKVAKRLLGIPEMIVGQGAALLYLDPSTIESGGVVSKEDLLSHLAAVMGTDALVAVFNPKRKRLDERVAQETVRQRVAEGLRKLTQLGFLTVSEENRIHLRSALMRFADPVRGAGSPRDALEKLIARGEVSLPNEADVDEEEEGGEDVAAGSGPGDNAPTNEALETPRDDASEEDEYVFDADAEEPHSGADFEAPDVGELDSDLDDSFGIDFDEPPTSKTQNLPPPPPSLPEDTEKRKPSRKKRRAESLHPEAAAEDLSAARSNEEPKFDEFD